MAMDRGLVNPTALFNETFHDGNEYFISEGNKLGYMDTHYSAFLQSAGKKLVAGEDLKKGQLVYIHDEDPTNAIVVKACCTGNVDNCIGVAMFDTANGEDVAVETEGLFKVIAGGSISAGALVSAGQYTDASSNVHKGVVVTATALAQDSSTKAITLPTKVVGIALCDATAGNYVYVKFAI